jgi:hypothetical protein
MELNWAQDLCFAMFWNCDVWVGVGTLEEESVPFALELVPTFWKL